MESRQVVDALSALAQASRLAVFRLLVQAGPTGLAAGRIADALAIPPATLSFHLSQLVHAGLVDSTREGRSIIYSADYDAMNALMGFLTDNCCGGDLSACAPRVPAVSPTRRSRSAHR